jgi:hypothetical protein
MFEHLGVKGAFWWVSNIAEAALREKNEGEIFWIKKEDYFLISQILFQGKIFYNFVSVDYGRRVEYRSFFSY